jgi:hypothetical protein
MDEKMLNWDLYTHPKAKLFAKQTPNSEKHKLADAWKRFMDQRHMYISFHEWNNNRPKSKPNLAPPKAILVSCPVTTLSLSDLGKEIRRIKKARQQEQEKEDSLQVQHQQYHVLIELKIQDLHFRLKTLIDTGSDLNLLNKHVISVSLWEKNTSCSHRAWQCCQQYFFSDP